MDDEEGVKEKTKRRLKMSLRKLSTLQVKR